LTDLPNLAGAGRRSVYRVKITYRSGYSDIGECDTEEEARIAVSQVTQRMMAGEDGITDVTSWEVP